MSGDLSPEAVLFAQVLPDPGRALNQLFTYQVPARLRGAVRVGAQVLVPFGPRTVVGIVAELMDASDRPNLKEIEAILEDVPALPEDALPLARWIADTYLCDLGAALRPFFAEGMTYRIARRVRLGEAPILPELLEHPDAGPVLRTLQEAGKEIGLTRLRRALSRERLRRALRHLRERGLIVERAVVAPPRARERQRRLLEVAAMPEDIERYCQGKVRRAPARVACLRAAVETAPATAAQIARLAGTSTSAVQALVADGLLRPRWIAVRRRPWGDAWSKPAPPPPLTDDQAAAVAEVTAAVEAQRPASFLLYGVTASGKTEVFLRAIDRALSLGKQAIVLMPEISLTAQAVGIYRGRFGDRIAVMHSALSLGERWDEWQRIRTGAASVIVGARSAVFAPVRSLGLIVVDEEHEGSYKQDQDPRYHAREVALKRAELNGCPTVLASATPALETFYEAQTGRHRLLRLPARVDDRPLPAVRIVDMRGARGGQAILSNPLRQAIAARLKAGEQIILFLNRRGFATFLLCPACGLSVRCPDCGVALTYSSEARQVRCHHCALRQPAPDACARCGSPQIRFSGFGTERIERELRALFPTARLGRMDRDTTARKGSHVQIVGKFQSEETNVLIGTQMITKGFDFPGVTLVGVISADTSLNLPDFRAAERTFQLLTQVAGRAGRGQKEGEVIVQTYRPDDYSVDAASKHDYEAFYQVEIESRRELSYPPASQLVNLVVTEQTEERVAQRAEALGRLLRERAGDGPVAVVGPAPAPLARLRRRHRWHVLLKGPRGAPQQVVREALAALGEEAASVITIDVDPISLM